MQCEDFSVVENGFIQLANGVGYKGRKTTEYIHVDEIYGMNLTEAVNREDHQVYLHCRDGDHKLLTTNRIEVARAVIHAVIKCKSRLVDHGTINRKFTEVMDSLVSDDPRGAVRLAQELDATPHV